MEKHVSERVVKVWNSLPPRVVNFSSLVTFSNSLNKIRLRIYTTLCPQKCPTLSFAVTLTCLDQNRQNLAHKEETHSYTRRDRSRGIRDEATACEPEVVSRERTWPPRPVARPSRATGRPFGSKYDNIDQNKEKKEGPGGARGQTGSRNMAATRFFDSATQTSYLTSNTSQCLSHTVTQFYSVNIKTRPKCTTTSGFPNPLQVWLRRFWNQVNFTTFPTISGTFESTSGFWIVLSGHRFRFGAPGFLIESISSRPCVIRRQHTPE